MRRRDGSSNLGAHHAGVRCRWRKGVAAGTVHGAAIDGAVRRQASGGAEPGRSFHLRLAASTASPQAAQRIRPGSAVFSNSEAHFSIACHKAPSTSHYPNFERRRNPPRAGREPDLKRETYEGVSEKGQIWTDTMMAGGPRGHTGLAPRARNAPRPSVSGRTAPMRAKGFRGRFPVTCW